MDQFYESPICYELKRARRWVSDGFSDGFHLVVYRQFNWLCHCRQQRQWHWIGMSDVCQLRLCCSTDSVTINMVIDWRLSDRCLPSRLFNWLCATTQLQHWKVSDECQSVVYRWFNWLCHHEHDSGLSDECQSAARRIFNWRCHHEHECCWITVSQMMPVSCASDIQLALPP